MMQKRSISGSSGAPAAGSAVDAMTALTAAVQELQAAMSALAGLLQQDGAISNGTSALPDQAGGADISYKSYSTPEDAADARRTAFEDETIREFDIPNARLRGALDRAEMQGLGDGATGRRGVNIAELEEQRADLDERGRQRLLRHGEQLRDAGELTAQDELELTKETERLATDETKAAASLSRGVQMQDYLPALSANRPAAFLRADSMELASIWRGRLGEGESGGQGLGDGETLGLGERGSGRQGDAHPSYMSFTSHPGSAVDYSSTERLAEAIGRLADAILNGGGRSGSALHPGEAQGGLNGLLQSAKVSARPDGYN